MTVKQAAERMEISDSLCYSLISAGKIRHIRIGHGRGRIRITEDAIAEYLESCTSGVREEKPVPRLPKLRHIRLD